MEPANFLTGALCNANKNLQIGDFTNYKNSLYVGIILRKENKPLFNEMFNMLNENDTYNTMHATYNLLHNPHVRKSNFGEFSIRFKGLETWNEL